MWVRGIIFCTFIAVCFPPSSPFWGTWSPLCLEERHEAKCANLFENPGHGLCPVCYCISVSKTLSGVPWGFCGLWVWRMNCKKSTYWINCSVYFSRLILKSCDYVMEEICAASHHCRAVCVCCIFTGVYSYINLDLFLVCSSQSSQSFYWSNPIIKDEDIHQAHARVGRGVGLKDFKEGI